MQILVVDDQAAARQFLEKILKDWGHTVYLAENGSEAWRKNFAISTLKQKEIIIRQFKCLPI